MISEPLLTTNDKLRSSGDSAVGSARPAQLSGVPGTSCARGAKLRSSGAIDQVDLMHISILDEDSSFRELVRRTTEADAYPSNPSKDCRLSTCEGVYWLGNRLYIPPPLCRHVVDELHASAYGVHFSAERTTHAITRRFFWPHIKRQVRIIISQCTECHKSKPRSKKAYGLLQPIPAPDRPWEQITLDLATDLPRTANVSVQFDAY